MRFGSPSILSTLVETGHITKKTTDLTSTFSNIEATNLAEQDLIKNSEENDHNRVILTISADKLRASMGGNGKVSLQCDRDGQLFDVLSGVFTCWSQSNGIPQKQITCPNEVQKEDTCDTSTIIIRRF